VDLVNKAGAALSEILKSIKEAAAIVVEIASASMEQSSGIEQINKSISHLDEVNQQNSALVEENAATAKMLEQQSRDMAQRVDTFRIDERSADDPASSPAPEHADGARPRPAGAAQSIRPIRLASASRRAS